MPAKIPQEVREKQLNSLPGKRFVRWLDGYCNQKSKAVMCCDYAHEWSASVDTLIHGRGCPHCAGKYVYSIAEREAQLNALPGKRFVKWVGGYRDNTSRAVMSCSSGHEWDATVNKLLMGRGCPKCVGLYHYSATEREKQLEDLSGISFVRWDAGYKNARSKAVVQCDVGHQWSASVDSLLNRRTGCQKCAGKYRYSTAEREAQLKCLPGVSFVRWDGRHKNCESRVVMRCDKNHEWSASLHSLLNTKAGCPMCARYGFNPNSDATLYALCSECGGHIKIGITGNADRRISELTRCTPFNFSTVARVTGPGHLILSIEKSFHQNFESSGFSGFNGATEWLKFNEHILDRLRSLSV